MGILGESQWESWGIPSEILGDPIGNLVESSPHPQPPNKTRDSAVPETRCRHRRREILQPGVSLPPFAILGRKSEIWAFPKMISAILGASQTSLEFWAEKTEFGPSLN